MKEGHNFKVQSAHNQIEELTLKPGLTSISLLALILAALLFLPASLYLTLVTGEGLSAAAVYVTALIFSSLGSFFRKEITRQEIFIIFATVGGVATSIPPFYWFVCRSYFMTSPISYQYKLNGIPLPELVPYWMAPPPRSQAHIQRTLLHPEWVPAIIIYSFIALMGSIANISLACFFSHLFVKMEKLRFPFAEVDSTFITVLSGEQPERMEAFLISLTAGALISAFIYTPQILGAPLVPLPYLDLTLYTQKYLPGAIIGIATTPTALISGFMLPLNVTACALIGSVAVWIFGNTLFIKYFPEVFPEWSQAYFEGMSIPMLYQRSYLWLWLPFQFGAVFGTTIFLVFRLRRNLTRMLREVVKLSFKANRSDIPPPYVSILIFLASAGGTVILHNLLIPTYPLWGSLSMSLCLSFILTLVATVSLGELGVIPSLGGAWSLVTWVSGYEGYPGWFFTPYLGTGEAASLVQLTKVSYLTETKPTDLYKALIIGHIFSLIIGLISMDIYWRMAPIPSAVYPNTQVFWPTTLMSINLWATRKIHVNPILLLSGTIIFIFLGFLGTFLQKLGIPFSLASLATGVTQIPTGITMVFIGSVLGKYVLARLFGRDKWLNIRVMIVAGFIAGASLCAGISMAASLLSRAAWTWPW